ncbi:MAG: HlyD family efflux transporter periplasmic adaptor subunit [Oscillospiraceae bacterium]
MNARGARIALTTLLALFAASYSIYVAVRFFYSPYQTETAFEYTVSDSYRAKAVAVREEKVLSDSRTGVLSYTCEDSEVVIPGTVIAEVYSDPADLRWQNLAEQAEREIELLSDAQSGSSQYWGNDRLNAQINDAVGGTVSGAAKKDLSMLGEQREKLQLLLGRKQILTGREQDFSERIAYLTSQREYAVSQITQTHDEITAPVGGYFCSSLDGYETQLTSTDFSAVSVENYRRAATGAMKPVELSGVGKVQLGHHWYLVMVVPQAESARFVDKTKVTLDFEVGGCREIPASVYQVIDDGSGEVAVVFQCNRVNGPLINLRQATVNVRFKSYSGLKINPGAIRFDGQTEGVYVIQGGRITFKEVTRLYTDTDFVLCEYNELAGNDALKLFDEVIVEGVDLYDGKIA